MCDSQTHSLTHWVTNGSKYLRCFRNEKLPHFPPAASPGMKSSGKMLSRYHLNDLHCRSSLSFFLESEWRPLIDRGPSRHCALIGWDHDVATPALLCHKELDSVNPLLEVFPAFRCVFFMAKGWLPSTERIFKSNDPNHKRFFPFLPTYHNHSVFMRISDLYSPPLCLELMSPNSPLLFPIRL